MQIALQNVAQHRRLQKALTQHTEESPTPGDPPCPLTRWAVDAASTCSARAGHAGRRGVTDAGVTGDFVFSIQLLGQDPFAFPLLLLGCFPELGGSSTHGRRKILTRCPTQKHVKKIVSVSQSPRAAPSAFVVITSILIFTGKF